MIPGALAWYGAVGTTAELIHLLLKFLDDFLPAHHQAESLRLKVQDDVDLIQQFMLFIKDLPPEQVGAVYDQSVLGALASRLQPLMIECEMKIRAVRETTEGHTKFQANTSKLAVRAVEEIEKELADWVRRLHVRFSLLSEKMKLQATRALGKRDPNLQFQHEMQKLSNELRNFRTNGQAIDYSALWLSDGQRVEFDQTRRGRRMNGLLAENKVMVEFISYNAAGSVESAREAIGELAFILNRSDPSIFHILKCTQIYPEQSASGSSMTYGLVFQTPPSLKSIRSLSDILADAKEDQSRFAQSVAGQTLPADVRTTERYSSKNRIAYQLAMSLRYLHSFGFVHQSIRTSNILIGATEDNHRPDAYLGGFQRARPIAGASDQRRIDADWRNNIYRSPDRIGTTDEETIKRHTMSHDIYSLGAVLLEPLTQMESKFKGKSAETVRTNLKQLTQKELSTKMGDAYTKIVLFCLESTPDSWLAAHLAEMSYVDEVLGPLEQLSTLT